MSSYPLWLCLSYYHLNNYDILFILSGPPGEPAGIRASLPSKHSVTISWSRGSENGGEIFAYIIEKFNIDTKEWVRAKNGMCVKDYTNFNDCVSSCMTGWFILNRYLLNVTLLSLILHSIWFKILSASIYITTLIHTSVLLNADFIIALIWNHYYCII